MTTTDKTSLPGAADILSLEDSDGGWSIYRKGWGCVAKMPSWKLNPEARALQEEHMRIIVAALSAPAVEAPKHHPGAAEKLDKLLTAHINRSVYVEQELFNMAAGKKPMPDAAKLRELANKLGIPSAVEPVAVMEADTLRSQLQKQCSEWGTYWRASDSHGVELTKPQAIELLGNALGVEVEIKDNGCATCDGTGMIGGEPCPDCTPPASPAEQAATQAEAPMWPEMRADLKAVLLELDVPVIGYVSSHSGTFHRSADDVDNSESAVALIRESDHRRACQKIRALIATPNASPAPTGAQAEPTEGEQS
ncbi:hypothetical protein C7T35_01170 [Variovorax sp. WS11]|uniref:hypothetical protein n=1 Tax=Variovorax sp. WS11 TaxID=1105204 RepID=UPI000D0D675E|nr:hypothetical protein [Variovorax sp. WS11]NDZ11541.1 hypothetical protein [Variovorax sp. WS11]PSL86607.1 hypothetical protein C7T35_01170 [Variovorax sp. WS11]